MRINDRIFNYLSRLIFVFILNLGVCSLSMLFLDMTFRACLVYSGVNCLWIPLVLPGIMKRLNKAGKVWGEGCRLCMPKLDAGQRHTSAENRETSCSTPWNFVVKRKIASSCFHTPKSWQRWEAGLAMTGTARLHDLIKKIFVFVSIMHYICSIMEI